MLRLLDVSEPHLKHLPPLGVQVVVHVVRGEHLRAHTQHGVRVRLPVDQALDDGVLGGEVLGLQQVDANDALVAAAHVSEKKVKNVSKAQEELKKKAKLSLDSSTKHVNVILSLSPRSNLVSWSFSKCRFQESISFVLVETQPGSKGLS